MSFIGTKHASPQSWFAGYVIGGIHVAVSFIVAVAAVSSRHNAQWQLMWAPLFAVDLPISLVGYVAGFALAGNVLHGYGSWSDPSIVVPLVVHGVFGSLAWAYVPPAISAHRKWRAAKRLHVPGRS